MRHGNSNTSAWFAHLSRRDRIFGIAVLAVGMAVLFAGWFA